MRHFNGSKSHFNVSGRQSSKYFLKLSETLNLFIMFPFCSSAPRHVHTFDAWIEEKMLHCEDLHRCPQYSSPLFDSLPGGVLWSTLILLPSSYLQVLSGNTDCCCFLSLPGLPKVKKRDRRWDLSCQSKGLNLFPFSLLLLVCSVSALFTRELAWKEVTCAKNEASMYYRQLKNILFIGYSIPTGNLGCSSFRNFSNGPFSK